MRTATQNSKTNPNHFTTKERILARLPFSLRLYEWRVARRLTVSDAVNQISRHKSEVSVDLERYQELELGATPTLTEQFVLEQILFAPQS